jgi:LacI family transcriptional regulator
VITIKDIARKAEVSIGTVDRVLHGRGRVSQKTADTIISIIKKTGYKTNIHARNLSLKKTYHFGVIMPHIHQDSSYWDILRSGIDQAVCDLSTFNIQAHYFFFDKYSEHSFIHAGNSALKQNMQGLLIMPVLSDACPAFVNSIPRDIPYVYVDSTVPGTEPIAYIGQDSFQSGMCGAKLMHLLLPHKAPVAIIRMLPNDFHINERVRGFLSYFKKLPAYIVQTFDASGEDKEEAFIELVASIDKQLHDCKGFFVTNAETHRVAKAIQRSEGDKKSIVGYDLIDENKRLVREKVIDFIISQKSREQGYQGITTLFRHIILKEPCAKEMLMPIDIITSENLSYYH